MSLTRPNLKRPHPTLDEPSFQGLLSAAFTIQEHNDQLRKKAQPTLESHSPAPEEPHANRVCLQCGAVKAASESPCPNCGPGQLRPGERLQRNWASMWLMSQERGLWPERLDEVDEAAEKTRQQTPQAFPSGANGRRTPAPLATQSASNGLLGLPSAKPATTLKKADSIRHRALDPSHVQSPDVSGFDDSALDNPEAQNDWSTELSPSLTREHLPPEHLPREGEGEDLLVRELEVADADTVTEPLAVQPLEVQPLELSESIDASLSEAGVNAKSAAQRWADWRVTLHFHRADVYLGVAILVAAVALLWPAASSPHQPSLGLVDRALIALGIAEAPAPVVHLQGDPGIEVWVDPHHALYYCPGEEQYGKTPEGRFTSQRAAEMDSFEPAGRTACE